LKIEHGAIVENIIIITNLCAKFNYDRMRNGTILWNRTSDNNKNNNKKKNNVRSHWNPFPGPKNSLI